MESLTFLEAVATPCFFLAIVHSFLVKQFHHIAKRFPNGSIGENFFHLVGEVEVVFGIWAAVLVIALSIFVGSKDAVEFLEKQNFTEPAFVFVIMTISATRPILHLANQVILAISRLIPINRTLAFYFSALTVGPLLGSFITEPAAMTVVALILLKRFYSQGISTPLKYATLGLLFVNVSIGGTLTPYAAPPVLMVATLWEWDLAHMWTHFGWKAIIAVFISASIITYRFRSELSMMKLEAPKTSKGRGAIPSWVVAIHLLFLILVVLNAHHWVVFMGLFLFFLGLVSVTREYNEALKLREGLLVGFFLGGLVVLGGPQRWWLEPLLSHLESLPLYLGAIGLTAFTDNAALTYLGAQVPTLTDVSKYALVAGAVVGGGLTVIANAPNPVGFGILNRSFGSEGVSPGQLFLNALIPTVIAGLCFWVF